MRTAFVSDAVWLNEKATEICCVAVKGSVKVHGGETSPVPGTFEPAGTVHDVMGAPSVLRFGPGCVIVTWW